MKNKVCFVMPYFGKLPYNFSLWLSFCEKNSDFNWLFFTNDKSSYSYPKNVIVNYLSLEDLKNIIENRLNEKVSLENPYKLCDFRPLYGVIFEDYLKDYGFWGYGDLDTIIGDLSNFVTDERLNEYDKISLMGHLSVLRNNDLVNIAYKDCNYLSIIQNRNNINFDEIRFDTNINNLLKNRGCKILEHFESFDICYEHYCFYNYEYVGSNRVKIIDHNPSIFEYDNGKLFEIKLINDNISKREIAYAHFIKRKILIPDNLNSNRFVFVPEHLTSDYSISKEYIKDNTKDSYSRLLLLELKRAKNVLKRLVRIGK